MDAGTRERERGRKAERGRRGKGRQRNARCMEQTGWSEEELTELYFERCAIREYDGGMTREAAEKAAYWEWRKRFGKVKVPDVIREAVSKYFKGNTK
jgi:hypothetical protein